MKTFKDLKTVPVKIKGNGRRNSLVIWNIEFDSQDCQVISTGTSEDKKEALIKILVNYDGKTREVLLANAQVDQLSELKPTWIKSDGKDFELLVSEFIGISVVDGQIYV